MKELKPLLLLQIFTLLPSVVFLVFYAQFTPFSLLIVALLFIFMFLNIRHYVNKQKLSSVLILLSILGSFMLYGFSGLGSNTAPQTFETLYAQESVTHFELQTPSPIDKVCFYTGIDYNSFSFEYYNAKRWKNFYSYRRDYPYSFRWNCKKVRVKKTSQILLRPAEHAQLQWSTDNDLMLGEIRFSYKGKPVPYRSSRTHFNDEPETSIDQSYYGGGVFDEIYFARTAYEILHHLPIYENTHPYLGKHLVGLGIQTFGMTPFGWRFTNILFATLLVFMLYLMGLRLFKTPFYALFASFLMTYSFMHLTQSRLALIDTFGVSFVFISYYFLYRFIEEQKLRKLLGSGLFFGLAVSIKWSAVFAVVGFVLIAAYLLLSRYPLRKTFAGYKLLLYGLLSYGVLAPTVYLLSFFDIFMHGGTLQSVIDYNTNMYQYHSTLVATHPYASPWWSWPLNLKPMAYYQAPAGDLVRSLNAFGNPAIFWLGMVAMLFVAVTFIRTRSLASAFILFAFVGLYLPYVFVGRLMFIYHFYYALPFVVLALVFMLQSMHQKYKHTLALLFFYLGVVAGLFLLFYPVISGYAVSQSYIDSYLVWLPKWWF